MPPALRGQREHAQGAPHEQAPQVSVAFARNACRGRALAGLPDSRGESEVRAHRAAAGEAQRIADREHEGEGDERPHAGHLLQPFGDGIAPADEEADCAVSDRDLARECGDRPRERLDHWPQLGRNGAQRNLVKAARRAGRKSFATRLHRGPGAVDESRAQVDEERTVADECEVPLSAGRARHHWVQESPVESPEPSQGLRIGPVRLALVSSIGGRNAK